jgi:hypothetical protein
MFNPVKQSDLQKARSEAHVLITGKKQFFFEKKNQKTFVH